MALIRDTYFAVILYTCVRTPICNYYVYSFSGYREKSICLYADKTETRNNVLTCVRTAVDSLRTFSCWRTTLRAHVYASKYVRRSTNFTYSTSA